METENQEKSHDVGDVNREMFSDMEKVEDESDTDENDERIERN
ncbi:hypothetical protein Hs30E_14040 [Lactococcus hodotermopsidis]|uniref:Uncharacterized protein n=1 Tax=Pseudolactococcus hodotermopsidis TaxID=2709157 RepID=A0A6A0BDT4_9LACT|nr:hypothetical protein Hs30E_14040 [Lactococcus hodotermopsidis]